MAEEKEIKMENYVNTEAGSQVEDLNYEATVTLPSKGLLYKDNDIPSEVSIRGMTTRDEKVLYTSMSDNAFKRVLRNCIISPKNIDINKLVASDEMFLILQLRMVTYGNLYKVALKCPHCGETSEYNVDLSKLNIEYLDDNFIEPIEIKLPRTKKTVGIKLLRNEDTEFIEKYSRKQAKDFNIPYREVEYIVRLAKFIKQIDGKDVDFITARAFIENLPSMDSAKIRTVIDKINLGVDTNVTQACRSCGKEFDFNLPLTSEFFHPTIE